MGFTTKRGRPVSPARERRDCGTEELQRRRRVGLTAEIIDIFRQKGLINEDEHWAGLHLRWLYTIKFGAPGVSAVNLEHFYGRDLKIEDEDWRESREKEYLRAIIELKSLYADKIVMNVAVFDRMINLKSRKINEIEILQSGLTQLCKLWGRQNR